MATPPPYFYTACNSMINDIYKNANNLWARVLARDPTLIADMEKHWKVHQGKGGGPPYIKSNTDFDERLRTHHEAIKKWL